MNRSIRRTIYNTELDKIFNDAKITEDHPLIHKIKTALLDDVRCNQLCLLKNNIRTIDDIDIALNSIENLSIKNSIKNCLTVSSDLELSRDISEIIFASKPIAFFVGTGISKLLGIPKWDELANEAIKFLKNEHYLNETEESKLKNEYLSPKQIISIFHAIYKEEQWKLEEFYNRVLTPPSEKEINPYDLLKILEKVIPHPVIKVTTNLDKEWEKILDIPDTTMNNNREYLIVNNIKPIYENFSKEMEFREDELYKIHGSLDKIENSIMTVKDYVENYRNDDGLKGFLDNLFKEYNVIFFGTSLQEIEILEHCIKDRGMKHFALVDSKYGDDNLFRIKQNYFRNINVKAIPYYTDFQGYERFYYVINAWIKEIRNYITPEFNKILQKIDEV